MSRPNIVVIMCDQLRAHEVGCYGNPVARTPHIDRLAREGVRFEHAVSSNPVCMPARSPYDVKFSPYAIERVQASDLPAVKPFEVTAQIQRLVAKSRRYVSDGDPNTITVPAADKADVDPAKTGGQTLKTD